MKVFISLFIALFLLTGCAQSKAIHSQHSHTEKTIGNPTAKEILIQNPNADIFQYKEIIYVNASHIEWVQQTELTIGDHVGTIVKQYKDGVTFEEEMATKLPAGTEIYEPLKKSGPILIVKLNGKEIRYGGLIEG